MSTPTPRERGLVRTLWHKRHPGAYEAAVVASTDIWADWMDARGEPSAPTEHQREALRRAFAVAFNEGYDTAQDGMSPTAEETTDATT